jgi:tRNA(Glu) U13 pseudouridine synthase TruD
VLKVDGRISYFTNQRFGLFAPEEYGCGRLSFVRDAETVL